MNNTHPHFQSFGQHYSNLLLKLSLVVAITIVMLTVTLSMNVSTTQAHTSAQASQALPNSVTTIIYEVFGPTYGPAAVRVAMCESSLNPQAYNPLTIGGSHAMGLFQILYPSTWSRSAPAGTYPYNVRANIVAAHNIFVRDGYSWREWACKP